MNLSNGWAFPSRDWWCVDGGFAWNRTGFCLLEGKRKEIFRRGEINFALFSFYMYTVLSIGDEVGERERGHGLGQILQLETKAIDWDRLVR